MLKIQHKWFVYIIKTPKRCGFGKKSQPSTASWPAAGSGEWQSILDEDVLLCCTGCFMTLSKLHSEPKPYFSSSVYFKTNKLHLTRLCRHISKQGPSKTHAVPLSGGGASLFPTPAQSCLHCLCRWRRQRDGSRGGKARAQPVE